MKNHRMRVASGILAAAMVMTWPSISPAAPPAGPDGDHNNACGPRGMGRHELRELPPPPGLGGGPGHFRGMGPEWGAPPPFLAGLSLTDDQQDKVFAILYAAAPAMREQAKALRKAHEALRELNTAQYDESRAKALAETAAKADSQLMLLRARTEHEIYTVLTPEQRKDLEERRHDRGREELKP